MHSCLSAFRLPEQKNNKSTGKNACATREAN